MSGGVLDQELAVALPDDLLQLGQILVVDPDPDVGVVDLDAWLEIGKRTWSTLNINFTGFEILVQSRIINLNVYWLIIEVLVHIDDVPLEIILNN